MQSSVNFSIYYNIYINLVILSSDRKQHINIYMLLRGANKNLVFIYHQLVGRISKEALDSGSAAKGSAINLEVAGSGPVSCRFFLPSLSHHV